MSLATYEFYNSAGMNSRADAGQQQCYRVQSGESQRRARESAAASDNVSRLFGKFRILKMDPNASQQAKDAAEAAYLKAKQVDDEAGKRASEEFICCEGCGNPMNKVNGKYKPEWKWCEGPYLKNPCPSIPTLPPDGSEPHLDEVWKKRLESEKPAVVSSPSPAPKKSKKNGSGSGMGGSDEEEKEEKEDNKKGKRSRSRKGKKRSSMLPLLYILLFVAVCVLIWFGVKMFSSSSSPSSSSSSPSSSSSNSKFRPSTPVFRISSKLNQGKPPR